MNNEVARLNGGPQDGARVTTGVGLLPDVVFVGPKWLGDGFAAWSREQCNRFPVCYRREGDSFKHKPAAKGRDA